MNKSHAKPAPDSAASGFLRIGVYGQPGVDDETKHFARACA